MIVGLITTAAFSPVASARGLWFHVKHQASVPVAVPG